MNINASISSLVHFGQWRTTHTHTDQLEIRLKRSQPISIHWVWCFSETAHKRVLWLPWNTIFSISPVKLQVKHDTNFEQSETAFKARLFTFTDSESGQKYRNLHYLDTI